MSDYFVTPMDYSPPASSVHGVSQARILEWVAISFSRGSSQPKDRTLVSYIAGRFFTTEPRGKPSYRGYFYFLFIKYKCVPGSDISSSCYYESQSETFERHWCNKEKAISSINLWLLGAQLGASAKGFLLCARIVESMFHISASEQVHLGVPNLSGGGNITCKWPDFSGFKPVNIRDLHTVYCEICRGKYGGAQTRRA